MNRDEFDTYENLHEYWLKEDALRSLDYDLYFSLGKRYYCGAGCKVCYIAENFEQTKNMDLYPDDLEKHHKNWFTFFEYFGTIRTNDDLYDMKFKHPKQFEWYLKYGENFELCITDNAIFRLLKLPEVKLKTVGDISISTDFLMQAGVERVLKSVKELYHRYGIQKIKYIDCGNPEVFADVIKWANELELHNCVHHDFRTTHREILNHAWAEYQNTWVTNEDGNLLQIYRESVHLYYDRFYYSSDDASDIRKACFYIFEDDIDINEFIYGLVTGKQKIYHGAKDRNVGQKFIDYYNSTQEFKVNKNFNFIPRYMFPPTSKFFYEMEKLGWQQTKYGLYINDGNELKPLLERVKL